jgi:hypothetical protein
VGEDLPEPREEFGFGGALELREIPNRLGEGLLNKIRGIELGGKTALDLAPGDDRQPRFETAEESVGGGETLRNSRRLFSFSLREKAGMRAARSTARVTVHDPMVRGAVCGCSR